MNILRLLFRDRSFAYKFTLLTTIPVIIVAVGIALLATKTLEESVRETTYVRVKGNTYLAALSMSNPYIIYNKILLDSFVDSLKQEKDISYAFVVDYNDGRILAHSNHTRDGQYFKASETPKIQISGTGIDGIAKLEGIGYEAVSPIKINGELFGIVRVGFTLDRAFKEIDILKLKIIGITILAIIFSTFLSLFLARLLGKPILALAHQAQEVAEGKFDQDINYESQDVVGKLSNAFKKMTEELRKRIFQIREFNNTLEKRVEERTKELQDAQEEMLNLVKDLNRSKKDLEKTNLALIQSEKEAEAANKAKGEFLANMSHEIRTPLNAIVGLTYLAKETEPKPKLYDYLDKIGKSGETLLNVINDILDFSKIEAGKLTMESVEFYLEDVLNNVANMVSMKADEKGLKLIFVKDKNIPEELVGDPLRLTKVLLNLVSNAIKFTAKGEVVITPKLIEDRGDIVTLKFEVKDTGIGLSKGEIKKLFKAFNQADTSTTRMFGGTGLGLVICKRLVDMMGGDVELVSEQGKGCTFSFTAELGRHSKKRDLSPLIARDFRGLRALVIDDSKMAGQNTKQILESIKIDVTLASSGQEALKIIDMLLKNEEYFDIVFTEQKMPVMDGIETVRQIKHKPIKTPIIIMVTAFGKDDILNEAQNFGFDDFVTKPVSPSTIFNSLMNAFSKKSTNKQKERFKSPKIVRGLGAIAGAKILLAEDNKMNQQVACELLASVGMEVTIADNGKAVFEILQNETFDAILMDLQMPVMDGFTTTQKIRRLDSKVSKTPIIALTAHAMSGDRAKSIQAGMNDHITKPLDPDELFNTLVKWIEPKKQQTTNEYPRQAVNKSSITLPDLPGIDISGTLRRIGGNKAALVRLLKNFSQEHADSIDEIEAHLKEDEIKKVKEAIHNLKGITGTIGALDLYQVVMQAEQAILADNIEEFKSLITNARKLLNQVLTSIKLLDDSSDDEKVKNEGTAHIRSLDPIEINTALLELKELLQNRRFNAGHQADVVESLLKGSELQNQFNQLKPLVDRYRFKEALDAIDQLIETASSYKKVS